MAPSIFGEICNATSVSRGMPSAIPSSLTSTMQLRPPARSCRGIGQSGSEHTQDIRTEVELVRACKEPTRSFPVGNHLYGRLSKDIEGWLPTARTYLDLPHPTTQFYPHTSKSARAARPPSRYVTSTSFPGAAVLPNPVSPLAPQHPGPHSVATPHKHPLQCSPVARGLLAPEDRMVYRIVPSANSNYFRLPLWRTEEFMAVRTGNAPCLTIHCYTHPRLRECHGRFRGGIVRHSPGRPSPHFQGSSMCPWCIRVQLRYVPSHHREPCSRAQGQRNHYGCPSSYHAACR